MSKVDVLKPTIFRPISLRPLLLVTILAWFPLVPMANAESIELLPSVSLQIGEQDRRGNYWDGYDWRDQRWWQDHQGRDLGERNRHGHYWDGHRWQNRDSWRKNYYYREGRYQKYDKHYDNHGKKHHRGKGHERHHDDD
ncbi:DUF2502 domain-containing protein [Yersinia intermedia]|jgi:hypothetical protein|uniref:DUF2502 domain-containing protein n=1 Tax=Yersinia intermedia TaxID=631 RepID=A0A209A306_YERIN|nr:DUF2502 domain-containing protein [Yersinia intermedia]MCB5313864.1 DUF2502 domain-containing protein [Yersinia intermedia]MCB5322187.1 DUF2502 domain-containing protein [Yersinia intermedia]MCB5325059.1 DUF2502 domain-containing protein [Yersinia intermedia]OVZ87151.1 DUF2502 domain-containing protein [Yersinia intermedia]UNK24567.1 DUF2502 domain-containing protein [Yersinia intermedia]